MRYNRRITGKKMKIKDLLTSFLIHCFSLLLLSLLAGCTPVGYDIVTISARWSSTTDPLTISDPMGLLKEDEVALLESSGLTGTIDFFRYFDTGGDSSRLILVFQSPSSNPVRLPIPDETSVIYIQTEHGWRTIPEEFAIIEDRSLRIETVSYNGTDVTEAVIELPGGGSELVGGADWPDAPSDAVE
jgi:hypothetical protein